MPTEYSPKEVAITLTTFSQIDWTTFYFMPSFVITFAKLLRSDLISLS
mgnify:CR=1 FL=1